MADTVGGHFFGPGAVGVNGICLFAPTGPDHSSFGWHMQFGVQKSIAEGTPSQPSLWLPQPGAWRFRWQITSGNQTISVYCKQIENVAPYPSMVVKANPSIGVNSDVTGTSTGSTGWIKIGPITVTATNSGIVWVELRNNLRSNYDPENGNILPWAPCYFDNLGS